MAFPNENAVGVDTAIELALMTTPTIGRM